MRRTEEQQRAYLTESAIALKRLGFTVQAEENGALAVEWNGQSLFRINGEGEIRYSRHIPDDPSLSDALMQAIEATGTVAEYMDLMEQAPPLKASGLEDGFKLLGEFNDVVLAGRMTRYGATFVTWSRGWDHTSLTNGHYFMENYEGAKQDLAVRARLVQEDRFFTPEQLTEVYRSICETLDSEYPLTDARRALLESAAAQIENGVPDLEQRVVQSNREELDLGDEMQAQAFGM